MSDKVVVINDGKIAQFGTPENIINNPKSKFVEHFILDQLNVKKITFISYLGHLMGSKIILNVRYL